MTICRDCQHVTEAASFLGGMQTVCLANPKVDPVSGDRAFARCYEKNSGACPDFEAAREFTLGDTPRHEIEPGHSLIAAARSFWRRLRGARGYAAGADL